MRRSILYKLFKESRFSPSNLKRHLDQRHINMYKSDKRFSDLNINNPDDLRAFASRYDQIADELSHRKVAPSTDVSSRYIGYMTSNGRVCKYDTKYHDFVVYDNKYTISMHKKSISSYKKTRDRDFFQELPYNQSEERSNSTDA